jgi:hypothetical protein
MPNCAPLGWRRALSPWRKLDQDLRGTKVGCRSVAPIFARSRRSTPGSRPRRSPRARSSGGSGACLVEADASALPGWLSLRPHFAQEPRGVCRARGAASKPSVKGRPLTRARGPSAPACPAGGEGKGGGIRRSPRRVGARALLPSDQIGAPVEPHLIV